MVQQCLAELAAKGGGSADSLPKIEVDSVEAGWLVP
jgi:hypothetical protein